MSEKVTSKGGTMFLRVLVTFMLFVGLAMATAAESAQGNKAPRGGKAGMILWALEVVEVMTDTLEDALGSEDDDVSQFFGIPRDEYDSWPERWQNVLKEVRASPDEFHRRTIHTLKMLHSPDWEMLEKMASYALGGHLLATGFFEADLVGITPDEQVELEAMGIINSGAARLLQVLKPRSESDLYRFYVMGEHGLILWFRDPNHEVDRSAARITRTGREILELLEATPNIDHLYQLGVSLKDEGIRTELWKVTRIPETSQFKLNSKLWEVRPEN